MKKLLALLMLLVSTIGIAQAQSGKPTSVNDKVVGTAQSSLVANDPQLKALRLEYDAAESALLAKAKKDPKYNDVVGYVEGRFPAEEAQIAEIKRRMNERYTVLTSKN